MKRLAIVLGMSLLLAACAGGSHRGNAIAWISDRPARLIVASRPLASPCRSSQLRASLFLQGATGSQAGGVLFRNNGDVPCALLGRPSIAFVGGGARQTRWVVSSMRPLGYGQPVAHLPLSTLRAFRPGERALVSIWWSNWCGPGADNLGRSGEAPAAIALTLPHRSGHFRLRPAGGLVAPRCDGLNHPSTVGVSDFVPAPAKEPSLSSRLPLRADLFDLGPGRGVKGFHCCIRAGEPFHYRVRLTNTSIHHRFRFGRCPTYEEHISSYAPERHVLNCRPAGTLPPGESAVFEMVLHVPADTPPGTSSIIWELAPRTYLPPFTDAGVIVRR